MTGPGRSLRLSEPLALVVGVTAVALVATSGPQLTALAVETGGLVVLALGVRSRRRGRPLLGTTLALVAAGIVVASLGLGVTLPTEMTARVELLPGLVGLPVLALGALGIRDGWGRRLVTTGAAVVFVNVLTSGVVHGAPATALLAAAVATVLAWDFGEQAVNLTEQVGRDAETWTAELAHGAGSLAVGVAGVGLAVGFQTLAVTGLSLAVLALLLAGAVALMAALYN